MRKIISRTILILAVCVFNAIPMVAYAGHMMEIDGIKAYIPDAADDIPDMDQQMSIEVAAQIYQTNGGTYVSDEYHTVKLAKDSIIYAMIPGQSPFYTDQQTVSNANTSEDLNALLQVRRDPVRGLRTGLAAYQLKTDMWVAAGKCEANTDYGVGKGTQYLVPITIAQRALFSDDVAILQNWDSRPRVASPLPNAA